MWTYQDAVSWQHGKHELKAWRAGEPHLGQHNLQLTIRPSVSILDTTTAAATGDLSSAQASAQQNFANINNLALNSQSQSFYNDPSFRQYRLWEQGYFVQDSYRATRKLTVDVGLRYEIFNPFTEKNNLLSNAYVVDANGSPQACKSLPFDSTLSNVAVIIRQPTGSATMLALWRLQPARRLRAGCLWARGELLFAADTATSMIVSSAMSTGMRDSIRRRP